MESFEKFFIESHIKHVHKIIRQSENDKKGLLIAFEGMDGSGKSSNVNKLIDWLKEKKYPIVSTKWNSSEIVSPSIKKAKDKRILSPILYSLFHLTDFLVRYEQVILPALESNKIVICDRYFYTSLVRDTVRGIDVNILKKIFSDLRKPDILFFCSVSPAISYGRLLKEKGLSYYGSGMDLHLADNRQNNYLSYARKINKAYNEILPKNAHKLDTSKSIDRIFDEIKSVVERKLV